MKNIERNVTALLQPFKQAIGDAKYPSVCHDIASLLGKVDWTEEEGAIKCSAKGIVSQGNKLKGSMPPNSPATILFSFACNLRAACGKDTGVSVVATLPDKCEAWITQRTVPVNA